jgi:hypothetical protein
MWLRVLGIFHKAYRRPNKKLSWPPETRGGDCPQYSRGEAETPNRTSIQEFSKRGRDRHCIDANHDPNRRLGQAIHTMNSARITFDERREGSADHR